jgi:hypothetical protein
MAAGAAGAGASGAAVINAIKASGVVVRLESDDFLKLLRRIAPPRRHRDSGP